MRTIKLTHEEIAIIQRALGIAEMKFNDLRKHYIEQVVNVRGVDKLEEARKEADIMMKKENEYCDLLIAIKNGENPGTGCFAPAIVIKSSGSAGSYSVTYPDGTSESGTIDANAPYKVIEIPDQYKIVLLQNNKWMYATCTNCTAYLFELHGVVVPETMPDGFEATYDTMSDIRRPSVVVSGNIGHTKPGSLSSASNSAIPFLYACHRKFAGYSTGTNNGINSAYSGLATIRDFNLDSNNNRFLKRAWSGDLGMPV